MPGRADAVSGAVGPEEWGVNPLRVLFVCTHNGARSRIAEEFARRAAAERLEPYSASLESDRIGPASSEQGPVFLANVDALYDETSQRVTWSIPNFQSLWIRAECACRHGVSTGSTAV